MLTFITDDMSYYKESANVNTMIAEVKFESSVDTDSVDSWLEGLDDWLKKTKCPWIKSHINATSTWLNFYFIYILYIWITHNCCSVNRYFSFGNALFFFVPMLAFGLLFFWGNFGVKTFLCTKMIRNTRTLHSTDTCLLPIIVIVMISISCDDSRKM